MDRRRRSRGPSWRPIARPSASPPRSTAIDVRRVIHGQGADHVILQQLWRRRRIHRAYVTVHIGRDRRVYLVKSRAVPEDVLRRAEEPRIASATRSGRAALAGGGARHRTGVGGRQARAALVPSPGGCSIPPGACASTARNRARRVITYVHAVTGTVISRYDNPGRGDGTGDRVPAEPHGPGPAASSRSTGRDCSARRCRPTPR